MLERNEFIEFILPDVEEFIEQKNWHELKIALSEWPPQDLAYLIQSLRDEYKIIVFRLLPKDVQVEVFSELDYEIQEKLIHKLADEEVRSIIEELEPDDRAGLFEELPGQIVQKLLQLLSPEERKVTLKLLGYPENTVGRLMTPYYVAVRSHWTCQEAIEHIRKYGREAETIDVIYVVDQKGHLIDEIALRDIILAEPTEKIEGIMDGQVVYAEAYTDQEEAVKIMKKYNLNVLPVVDKESILLGIVTIDDMIDVLDEEQTEDLAKISGVSPEVVGAEFLTHLKEVPISEIYRSRVKWLVALLLMDFITGGILATFQEFIAKYAILVSFLPVLVDTAGNAGSQAATLLIRALALGTVKPKDWFFLLGREFLISGLLGLTMAIGISFMGFIRGGAEIAKVVIIAMFLNVVLGSLIGLVLPFIFLKLKQDPASASTPLITTLADILGTAVYLAIATVMLH
uniref:Magnesium transporter MgtE n=1 Tax=candidate division WOR-3 bacterium TaxID=2052148 RepID=A0A7V3KPR3_UNCW3